MKGNKVSNVLLTIITVLVLVLVVALALGVVREFKAMNKTDDVPVVESVDLTSEMWVQGFVIDTTKEIDMSKFDDLDDEYLLEAIDYNTTITSSSIRDYGHLEFIGDAGMFGFGIGGGSDSFINAVVYSAKGSLAEMQFGMNGWIRMQSWLSFEPITGNYYFEFAFPIRYDCTNWDLVKYFLTPVLAEDVEAIKPSVDLVANKPVKGFKLNDCYFGFDVDDYNVDDVLLEGVLVEDPFDEAESGTIQVRVVDGYYGSKEVHIMGVNEVYGDSYFSNDYWNNTYDREKIFPNDIIVKFEDVSGYYENNLWRILTPIYAEECEERAVGASIDLTKLSYVDEDDFGFHMDFSVSKGSDNHGAAFSWLAISVSSKVSGRDYGEMIYIIDDATFSQNLKAYNGQEEECTNYEKLSYVRNFNSSNYIAPYVESAFVVTGDFAEFVQFMQEHFGTECVTVFYSHYC